MVQTARPLTVLLLLWLAGVSLRLTIVAVPPVIPLIHNDLRLTQTQVGILSGLPMVLLAGAAIAGSLLIARFGAVATLIAGLLVCAVGSALRGVGPSISILYVMTILMSLGVAVMQPSLPPLVRLWFPDRIGFGTAIFTNGLIIGAILPVSLTIPFVLPLVGSWQLSFVFWAVPCVLIAAIMVIFARGTAAFNTMPLTVRRWWPNWRDPMIWRIGLMFGGVNSMYFATSGFLPDYLTSCGRSDLIGVALTALNVSQLLASFVLLAFADRLIRRTSAYVLSGLASFACIVSLTLAGGIWIVVATAGLGFFAGMVLLLILALPPLISAPDDVHRTASAVFTISYSCAVIVPIISGLVWDISGIPSAAFMPIAVCALGLASLAPTLAIKK